MLKATCAGFTIAVVLLFANRPMGAQGSASELKITFDGGYAYGISGADKSVTVGSMAPPRDTQEPYREHRLKLELKQGDVVLQESDIPPTHISEGNNTLGWDLTGYHVDIQPEGTAPAPGVSLPPLDVAAARASCGVSNPSPDNLAFIPDVAALAPAGAKAVPSWRDEVWGDIKLTGGKLSIARLAAGCLEFKDAAGTVRHRQRIANGVKGVAYSLPLPAQRVVLVFRGCCNQIAGRVVLRAVNGVLNIEAGPHAKDMGGPHEIGHPQDHFQMFYRLVAPAVSKPLRLTPTWTGPLSNEQIAVSPGEGCPGGRYAY